MVVASDGSQFANVANEAGRAVRPSPGSCTPRGPSTAGPTSSVPTTTRPSATASTRRRSGPLHQRRSAISVVFSARTTGSPGQLDGQAALAGVCQADRNRAELYEGSGQELKCPGSVEAARSKLAGLGEPNGPCSAGGADGPMRRAPPAAAVPASRAAVAVKVAARAVSSCSSVGPARGPRGHGPSTSTGRAPAASAQRSSGRNQPRSEPPGLRTTRPAAAAGPNVAGDRQDPAGRPAHTGRQRPQQPGDAVGQQDVPQQQPGDPVARGDWCPRQSWTVPRAEYGPTAQGGRPWPGAG